MPPNPDPVQLSESIVGPFRALSLAGLVVFWAALCASLAILGRDRIGTGARLRPARPCLARRSHPRLRHTERPHIRSDGTRFGAAPAGIAASRRGR